MRRIQTTHTTLLTAMFTMIVSAAAQAEPTQSPAASTTTRDDGSRTAEVRLAPFVAGSASGETARLVDERMRTQLESAPEVKLMNSIDGSGDNQKGWVVEGNVLRLTTTRAADGSASTDCNLGVAVSTYPRRAVKMTMTAGATVSAPSGEEATVAAQHACVQDAARQIAEKVKVFFESTHERSKTEVCSGGRCNKVFPTTT